MSVEFSQKYLNETKGVKCVILIADIFCTDISREFQEKMSNWDRDRFIAPPSYFHAVVFETHFQFLRCKNILIQKIANSPYI